MDSEENESLLKDEAEELVEKYKDIQINALDDIVSVNSLFTIAIFLGLAFASPTVKSLDIRPECAPTVKLQKRLVMYEVISFACFLLSSLVAKAIKLYLTVHTKERPPLLLGYHVVKARRGFLVLLSVLASITGVVFLTLSMVDVIQIKIGNIKCGIRETYIAVISLCSIVAVALLIYLPSAVITIASMTFIRKT